MRTWRGRDSYGVVHYDSGAKQTYIWPMCSTGHLDIVRLYTPEAVTCLQCHWAVWKYLEEDPG